MNCQEARRLLHDLVDDDIQPNDQQTLNEHLQHCPECQSAEHSLRQTVCLLQEISRIEAPDGFTAQVMQSLPAPRRGQGIRQLLVAAAVCLIVLVSPYLYSTLRSPQLICQDQEATIAEEAGRYVVAANQTVRGDLIVYKADLLVLGRVEGNVRVMDGHLALGAGATVSGTVAEQASSGAMRLKLAFAELWEDIGAWLFRR